MLLNLVRMKYRESVEFIAIRSITGQHTYSGSVGINLPMPSSDIGSTGYSAQSRPTIVYQPEQAQEFNRRLLTPISAETLDLLSSKGWAVNRVVRVAVRNINDLDNATSAGGPTPKMKPEFERFRHAMNDLRELQKYRQVELGYEKLVVDDPKQVADSIKESQVEGAAIITAAEKGYRFRRDGKGGLTLWTQPSASNALVLRVSPRALASEEMRQICEAFDLEPGHSYYRVVPDRYGQLRKPSSHRIGHSMPSPMNRKELTVSTRSLKEMMFYLSHGIDVPRHHVEKGLVTRTCDGAGREFDWRCMTGDLLRVRVSKLPPLNSAVSVHYRGYYFYIDDRDLNSKSTFNLLIELFNLEIRAGGGAQIPLLTI